MKTQAIANASELLKIHTLVKNDCNSLEVKHPTTRKIYPIKPFLRMCYNHIPTNEEMRGRGLNKRRWKMHHFFCDAQHFITSAGYPEGKHPYYDEWCPVRNDWYPVLVSVLGDIIHLDDPKNEQWHADIVSFPPELYNAMNNLVTASLQKHIANLPSIDDEEPFGALMIFQRHIIWKMSLQCIRAYPQINKELTIIESKPITSTADVNYLEEKATVLLTFKEMATCRSKFSHDSAFFSTITAYLETQEFATPADRNRAADVVRKLQTGLECGTDISRQAFFASLHGIFRPNLGLTAEPDVDAHLAVTAFHANGKENYGNRGAPRKDNANPQSNKRKSTMEATPEQKAIADLKSEFGNIRADLYAIMKFLGMTDKKPKFQNDVNKQDKEQANLAKIRKPKHTIKIGPAVSFPRRYVDEEDSEASEPEHQRVEHAMFSRVQAAPLPKLTVQSIFGPNSRTGSSRSVWDEDRIGYARPSPRSNEVDLTKFNALYSSPKYWEDDKASSTSSKTSLNTRTQYMEISEEQYREKPIVLHKIRDSSPYAERLLADYHKHLAQDDDCDYIYEANHPDNLRDHQKDAEDDLAPQDAPVTTSDTGRFGPRLTRQTLRMASYNYPSPRCPGDSDGPVSSSEDMADASRDDKNDIAGSSQVTVGTSSKPTKRPESAPPRSTARRATRSGTSAPTPAHKNDIRTSRPPTASEVSAAWPPLSAPGATVFNQRAATSTTASTSPPGAAFGDSDGDM
jgi:hypothetical protein